MNAPSLNRSTALLFGVRVSSVFAVAGIGRLSPSQDSILARECGAVDAQDDGDSRHAWAMGACKPGENDCAVDYCRTVVLETGDRITDADAEDDCSNFLAGIRKFGTGNV